MNWSVLWAQLKKLDKKIDDMDSISFQKVNTLPVTGEPNVIYFVPKGTGEESNYSDEYIWDADNSRFEKIGDTQIDELPDVTSADNGKVLGVANGIWDKVEFSNASGVKFYRYTYYSSSGYELRDGVTVTDLANDFEQHKNMAILYDSVSSHYFYIQIAPRVFMGNPIEETNSGQYRITTLNIINAYGKTGAVLGKNTTRVKILPPVTSADKGKVPVVNSDGEWSAETPEAPSSYVELGAKLLAGETTLTFTDESITTSSIFEFYTDTYGVNPIDISVSTGSLTLTFEEQANNLKVKVRVWGDENPIPVVKSVNILTTSQSSSNASVKFTYKEDGAVVTEQNILYSEASASDPIIIGDLIAIYFGLTASNYWTVKALASCSYNDTTYEPGDEIRSWSYGLYTEFTVTAV